MLTLVGSTDTTKKSPNRPFVSKCTTRRRALTHHAKINAPATGNSSTKPLAQPVLPSRPPLATAIDGSSAAYLTVTDAPSDQRRPVV